MSINCDSVGVPVTSRSVEAVDRLETATLELLGWRGDPIASLDKSIEIDPHFTMGHVARGMLDLLGTIPLSTPSTVQCISNAKSSLTDQSPTREKLHVQAMDEFYKGNLRAATFKWESILKDHPTDLLALKFAHDTYFYLGDSVNIRDSVARVFKTWKYDHSNSKVFGYVMGMYSFGLEETALYDKARQTALGALDRNPTDAWAVHTVAHVNEMLGTQREGLQFMGDTHSNWKNSGGLAVHLHWHTGLYMLELGQNERAMDLYDSAIRAHKSSGVLDLVDASSFLFRCEMADIPVEDRWDSVIESWNYLLDDRILVFNDLHMMWSALGAKKPAIADKLLDSMKSFADTHKSATEGPIMSEVGIALAEAVQGWYGQNYSKVVDCLLPVRHRIVNIGGSHAQRDIFNILLVKSSMKSRQHSLAKNLLSERIELKDHSTQSWLWYADTLQALGNTSQSVEATTTAHRYLKD